MMIVYPFQQPSVPIVNNSEAGPTCISSIDHDDDDTCSSPANSRPGSPFDAAGPIAFRTVGTASTSSKSKGKFKQREHSPSDDTDLELDDNEMPDLGSSDEEHDKDGEVLDGEARDGNVTEDRPTVPDPSSPSLDVTERRGGEGDNGKVRLRGGAWVTNYEHSRLKKMGANKQLMIALGIPDIANALTGSQPQPIEKPRARAPSSAVPTAPTRVPPARSSKLMDKL